jgi:hypothetical protein
MSHGNSRFHIHGEDERNYGKDDSNDDGDVASLLSDVDRRDLLR